MSRLLSSTVAGEAACLAAALLWAISLMIFRGPIRALGAPTVNLSKCALATVLQGLTILALGQVGALSTAHGLDLACLAASGLVGLVVGDTALFAAVSRLGVHRTLLIQTLSPAFAALVAGLWLGEVPTARQATGAVLVLAGIALVVVPPGWRDPAFSSDADGSRPRTATGLAFAVLAASGQGTGIVLAKVGMQRVPVLPASFFRLGTAAIVLLAIGFLRGPPGKLVALFRTRAVATRVVPATLIGTYLALFLMMAGVALAPASIAAVLLGTTPLFGLFLEAAVDRRRITAKTLLGTLAALAGVAVLSS